MTRHLMVRHIVSAKHNALLSANLTSPSWLQLTHCHGLSKGLCLVGTARTLKHIHRLMRLRLGWHSLNFGFIEVRWIVGSKCHPREGAVRFTP